MENAFMAYALWKILQDLVGTVVIGLIVWYTLRH